MSEQMGPSESSRPVDDLDRMLAEASADAVTQHAFVDAQGREDLLLAMIRARGSTSQAAVASVMSTTQSAVSDIENGRVDPRLSTLQRYARAVHRRLHLELVDDQALRSDIDAANAHIGSDYTLARVLSSFVRATHQLGPQSPAELAGRIGLPETPVEHTVARLEETGWVTAVPDDEATPSRFRLRDDRALVIGVSLMTGRAEAVLTNLRATQVLFRRDATLSSEQPEDIVATMAELVDELKQHARSRDMRDVIGLGVTLSGQVDGSTGMVMSALDFPTWRHVSLAAALQDRTGLRAVVENDANSLAMYEYLLQGEEQSLAVVLMARGGAGIGSGLVINGGIVHGIGGVSGEVGHITIDPRGELCRCHKNARGCLETIASPAAIVRAVAEQVSAKVSTLRDVEDLVASRNRPAIAVLRKAGSTLGRSLSALVSVVGPRRIVLFGPPELVDESAAMGRHFMTAVRHLAKPVSFEIKVDVITRSLQGEVEARAAAATAVHYFLSRPRHWLPTIAASPSPGHPREETPGDQGVVVDSAGSVAVVNSSGKNNR
jgi:predicted NBD/HSP70 family sugar kinase/DNA-binding XRE family transcriptional regulator